MNQTIRVTKLYFQLISKGVYFDRDLVRELLIEIFNVGKLEELILKVHAEGQTNR